jgi:hypothetical protein
MKLTGLTVSAIALVWLTAGAANAQSIDWGSETNRTWWNGVNQAELRELVAEAGGTWIDLPDGEDLRESRIDWPDLKDVNVREINCPRPERPMEARNCQTMMLAVAVDEPDDLEAWWLDNDVFLAFGRVDDGPVLYRVEQHAYGTTRGHVLANLMLFRRGAVREIDRIAAMKGSGW